MANFSKSITPHILVLALTGVLLVVGIRLAMGSWDAAGYSVLQPAWRNASRQGPVVQHAYVPPSRPAYQHVDCASSPKPCLALTFDDGPNPMTTPKILDVLDRQHVRATFFVIGSRAVGQEQLLRRMFYSGNEIGNHSWTHPDLTKLSAEQVQEQIQLTQAEVISAGLPAPTLLRPPYGAVNGQLQTTSPLAIAMWNIDPLDWKFQNAGEVKNSIVQEAKPGGVVDLHDIYPTTADAIEQAIVELKPKYELVTFSEMFNLQPGQRGEYFGR